MSKILSISQLMLHPRNKCSKLSLKFVSVVKKNALSVKNTSIFFSNDYKINRQLYYYDISTSHFRTYCQVTDEGKPSLWKRFKVMYRNYWYVLVPVHIVTSFGWFSIFYYAVHSGVDVVHLLKSIGLPEVMLNPLQRIGIGDLAVSYALFKLATPLRYTVTLGVTTVTIDQLSKRGYIKPVSRQRLKELYLEKKEDLKEAAGDFKDKFKKKKI